MRPAVTITVERSGAWRGLRGEAKRRRARGEPGSFARPVRLTMDAGTVLARPWRLPFRDASLATIVCLDVLEYVRNDDLVLDELARVIAPGGTLLLRVPASGPLAGIDAYNLMHYLVDITRRGSRPHETCEVGWRRHYGVADLSDLLGCSRFRIVHVRRSGLALTETIHFVAMALFRWLVPSPNRYRAGRSLARFVERFERRIVTPFGFSLELEATRLPDE